MMKKCLRCNGKMVENLDVKVEGSAYGIKVTQQGRKKSKSLKLNS